MTSQNSSDPTADAQPSIPLPLETALQLPQPPTGAFPFETAVRSLAWAAGAVIVASDLRHLRNTQLERFKQELEHCDRRDARAHAAFMTCMGLATELVRAGHVEHGVELAAQARGILRAAGQAAVRLSSVIIDVEPGR